MIRPESKLPFKILSEKEITEAKIDSDDYDGDVRIIIVNNDFNNDSVFENILSDNNAYDNDSITNIKDAEFIVHACNNYEKLIKLLKEITNNTAMHLIHSDKETEKNLEKSMNDSAILLATLKEIKDPAEII